jgi:hypothetical protein
MLVFERHSKLPFPVEDVFAYHVRQGAVERLLPPWEDRRVGRPLRRQWVTERCGYVEGRQFTDRQMKGPFAQWEHTHRFLPLGDQASELIDHVEYRLPAGWISDAVASRAVVRRMERAFRFRHLRARNDLERHALWSGRGPLCVAIAGVGGLVGSHLAAFLTTAGHDVLRLVRRPAAEDDEISWDPGSGLLDARRLEGVDAIVNLAGASISALWTKGRREAILTSRVQATQTLVAAMQRMERPPAVFVSASAVGAYGSRGGETLTELTELGDGYLADVCRAWEAAAAPAAAAVRVVTPRFGIVLSGAGGALAKMLPAFKSGLGARLGDGEQWWSWIALDDLLAAVEWVLHDEELRGVVNVTAPEPVTNLEFTKTLGRVLHRPAALAAPRLAVAKGLGGMGEEMLLASQRAVPARLTQGGFRFDLPVLEDALRFELGRRAS